jgi:LysR family transcriptional regulator, nitrogen assimilation regulatory protein
MRPTAAGATMVERARRALTELERARAEVSPAPDVVSGIVTVGLLESVAVLIAEPLVSAVRRDHPGIELRLHTAYSGHLQRWLDEGDLDVSLLYNLSSSPSLNVTPLVRERLWVVAPAAERLDPAHPVPFADLTGRAFIMPSPGHGLRTLIEAAAGQAGADLDTRVQTNSMALQKQLVLAGHGWTILPPSGLADDAGTGAFSSAPVCEPEIWRSIVLGIPRTGRVPTAVDVVARELIRQVRLVAGAGRWPSTEPFPGNGAL